MRLVSYNILDGGEGRADPLAEVIEAQRPDIIGLIEADFMWALERIANRFKMDFIHAPGKQKSVALLSRWPIAQTINHGLISSRLTRCLVEAKVVEPGGRAWIVGVLHLHSHATEADEQIRETEIAEILRIFAPHRDAKTPHVLMGDFNSNSPVQNINPALCTESTRNAFAQNGNQLPRRAIQMLLDAGYLDTLQVVDPRAAEVTGTFSTQHPGQRVDYIFTWGVERTRIQSAAVEQDRLAKYASDHFPVVAEIE